MRDVGGHWDQRHDEDVSLRMFFNYEMHEYGCVRECSQAFSPPCCRAWLVEECISRPFLDLFNCRTSAATPHPLAMFFRIRRVRARSRSEVCFDIDTDIVGVTMISGTLSVAFVVFDMIVGTGLGRLLGAWAVIQPIQMPCPEESAMRWSVDVLIVQTCSSTLLKVPAIDAPFTSSAKEEGAILSCLFFCFSHCSSSRL